jgi:TonB family protein
VIDAVSMLLLIAAEPESSAVRAVKADPPLAEAVKARQEAENGPHPEILDRSLGLQPDDYPVESLRADEEGAVRIALEVNAEGKPTNCSILQSSGHARLDEKTCQIAMERAGFRPARDKGGKAVASIWRSPPVRWKIPSFDPASLPISESWHATTIQVGTDGTLGECTVETSGNIMVARACEMAKAQHAKSAKEVARWWKSLTFVIATSNKDAPPNVSKPEWGLRQSRLVSAQLVLSGVINPISCETIITEGWALGGTACPPPDQLAPTPPNPDWSKARTNYTEISTYGQLR